MSRKSEADRTHNPFPELKDGVRCGFRHSYHCVGLLGQQHGQTNNECLPFVWPGGINTIQKYYSGQGDRIIRPFRKV